MYKGGIGGEKGGDGCIKGLDHLTERANLKPFGKRKCLLNLSISRQSLVPLVEQQGLMCNKAQINGGRGSVSIAGRGKET